MQPPMQLVAGSRLGSYEIIAPLGAGGMGEVYRARDTSLKREVAIKVLPDYWLRDAERLHRFELEAQATASLNHPNIVSIFHVGQYDGWPYIVTELLQGETLRDRLRRGPMRLRETCDVGLDIARGLAAAHDAGIVHRDLKPENLFLTKDESLKILDFGLAKLTQAQAAGAEGTTVSIRQQTDPGHVVGTVGYMAPEQVRGQAADARSDIFAFGVVLYEMLTSKRAFQKATAAETMTAILNEDPPAVSQVAPGLPPGLQKIVSRCLAKKPEQRFQHASDLGFALEGLSDASGTVTPPVHQAVSGRRRIWVAAAAVTIPISAALMVWWTQRPAIPVVQSVTQVTNDGETKANSGRLVTQFDVELRSLGSLGSEVGTDVILSPDGNRLVFVSRGPDGVQHLNTRRLDQSQASQVRGTEGANSAFFSPDGGWVGFWAAGELKKVPVEGGSPEILCDTTDLLGGAWGEDGNIIAAVGGGKLWRISSAGGTPTTLLDLANEHVMPVWPQVLSKNNLVIFTNVGVTGPHGATIEALSLSTGKRTLLARGGTFGRYLPNGYLTYVNQGSLFAVPFDLEQMQTHGTPTPVLDHVSYSSTFGFAQLDFSRTGAFVYRKDNEEQVTVEFQDEAGRTEPLFTKPGHYLSPHLSPDGKRLAFSATESGVPSLWVYDRQANRTTRLSMPPGLYLPIWTRDGRFLIFGSLRGGLSWIRSDGTGSVQPLIQGNNLQVPWSLSPDGNRLAYHQLSPATGFDLWTVPIHSSETGLTAGKPEPFLQTPAYETYPSFSPDGEWIAYGSNESGSWEVYVRAFPDNGKRVQVSTGGGRISFWSRSGHELLYRTDDQRIMVATYATRGGSFVVQKLRPWQQSHLADTGVLSNLDLAPDGRRMVVLTPATNPDDRQAVNHATFMLNFFEEVQRRARSTVQ